jgi:adenosylhomocysteinase
MGARVIICEVNAVRGFEAVLDGFELLPVADAARIGDIFVTATGMAGVIQEHHFCAMRDGAILANSGHFDVEIDIAALERLASERVTVREHLVEYRLPNNHSVLLLAQGRLVGQVAAEASPAAIMDLSFADQALSTHYLLTEGLALPPGVYDVPAHIDDRVATLKLQALGLRLDTLSPTQLSYANSWQLGTA